MDTTANSLGTATSEPATANEAAGATEARQGDVSAASTVADRTATIASRVGALFSAGGLVAAGLIVLIGGISLAGYTGHLYEVFLAGVIVDLLATSMVCGHMFFGPAAARIQPAALLGFRVSQIGEAVFPAALFWIVDRAWSPTFLLILTLAIWSRVATQLATIYFHISSGRWGAPS
jgi:hypothetical protein